MVAAELQHMKSQNFEFLRSHRAVLAVLSAFAERYAQDDPASSLIKQRRFVERVVPAIYERYHLVPPLSDNLNDLMTAEATARTYERAAQELRARVLGAVTSNGNSVGADMRAETR
jgi:type I restriction enzyme R subunit